MQINLKISNREKIMLIVLGIIMVVGVYYKFIYSKQMAQIKELSAKQEENRGKINSLQQDKALNEKIKKDIKIVNAKILESTEEFFPSIIEEKILVILDDMINKTNIQCDSIAISEASDEALSQKQETAKPLNSLETIVEQYKALEENKNEFIVGKNEDKKEGTTNNNATNSKDKVDTEIKKTSIALNFKGPHDNVMKFIDEVKGFYKRIVIKNINLVADGDNLSGNMILDFYAVPKFIEEDIDYNKWNFDGLYGKTNIFKDNSPGKIATTTGEKESDFAISVRPISSDLPTVILGRTSDKESYLYTDNEGIENIEIYLNENGGKYYYKYKTGKEAYPKDFKGEGVPFTFEGDNIFFKVFSRSRVSQNDVNGVNIKLYNNTDKNLQVVVEDDDKTRPRINIIKENGDITVKSN